MKALAEFGVLSGDSMRISETAFGERNIDESP